MARRFRGKQRKQPGRTRLACEALEDRRLLAVVNDQTGLEAAIAAADPAIEFGNDITLVSEVVIDMPVNIDGMGFTLTGSGADRVLNVSDGDDVNQITVNITNLTVTGGSATSGGGIANAETLLLNGVDVSGNTAYQAGFGSAAFGGGILNTGHLILAGGSSVSGNSALENIPAGNIAFGGGIASIGVGSTLRIEDATVAGNTVQGSGGGIFHRLGTMEIIDSAVSNNTADAGADQSVTGGGIAAYSQGPGNTNAPLDITISGSSISI